MARKENFMTEENQNENIEENKEQNTENQEPIKVSEPIPSNKNIFKYIGILVAVFLATFCAVYVVVDMNMNRLGFTPFVVGFQQFEKIFDEDSKYVEQNSPAPVKIESKSDKYIISVNLKTFDNDPNNLDIEIAENGVKITGKVIKNDGNETRESSFYQSVMFPNKINDAKATQEHKGNKLIITLPFKK